MDKNSMSNLISEELARIPHGDAGSPQNIFRSTYQMRRQHGLSGNPNQSPKEPFVEAVGDVRKDNPGFEPTVTDPSYFGWSG